MKFSVLLQIIYTTAYIIGTFGNILALWILNKLSRRRNAKHVFMLRCLVANDLVSLLGMWIVYYLKLHGILVGKKQCIAYVILRAFGVGSGCVAFVMAVERWIAFTKPFFYQQVSGTFLVFNLRYRYLFLKY